METDMTGRIPKTAARLSAAILAATALLAIVAGTAGAEVVYNNVPSPLPGNFASIGLAATSTSEFGGQVELAGTARKNPTVTVVMSSWACETGTVESNCKTAPAKKAKTFKVPVTIRIYGAGPGELAEPPLAEKTKTVKMSYRPSSNPVLCPGGEKWYLESTKECSHGYAFPIAIKVKSKKLPKNAIVTVSYPTTSVPAQSLNVSVSEPPENTLSVGKHPVPYWVVNSTWPGMYETGATDIGTLGFSQGLNSSEGEGVEYQPVIAISAE
jgi:hypothetical protein